jgi:hypothetical protein
VYYQVWPRNVHTINTWSSTSISVHARKRRVLNYAFSEAALRDAEVFLHSNIDRWLELLRQSGEDGQWTGSLNMCDSINWLVFDILGDLCFGQNFNMKEPDSNLRHIPEVMVSFLELLHPVSSFLNQIAITICADAHRLDLVHLVTSGYGSSRAVLISS